MESFLGVRGWLQNQAHLFLSVLFFPHDEDPCLLSANQVRYRSCQAVREINCIKTVCVHVAKGDLCDRRVILKHAVTLKI